MTVGSLFSGCLGLDLGLEAAGWKLVWACENYEPAQRVIARQRPEVPVIPDVRQIDAGVQSVTLLAGGFPCQDLSNAGKGEGLSGNRSGLWFAMADAIRLLRPPLVLIENVPGIFSKMGARPGESAFGTVIADLAEAGYVGSWIRVSASDVGAPHGRDRVFILAANASGDFGAKLEEGDGQKPTVVERVASTGDRDRERQATSGVRDMEGSAREPRPSGSRTPADASSTRRWQESGGPSPDEGEPQGGRQDTDHIASSLGSSRLPATRRAAVADSDGGRREQRDEGERGVPEPRSNGIQAPTNTDGRRREVIGKSESPRVKSTHGSIPDGCSAVRELGDTETVEWGIYADAILRWERIFRRPAPPPTDDRGRLSPEFEEWMLGFPHGWTEGESRTARLRMLGNSVQVQCGEVVGRMLMEAV